VDSLGLSDPGACPLQKEDILFESDGERCSKPQQQHWRGREPAHGTRALQWGQASRHSPIGPDAMLWLDRQQEFLAAGGGSRRSGAPALKEAASGSATTSIASVVMHDMREEGTLGCSVREYVTRLSISGDLRCGSVPTGPF